MLQQEILKAYQAGQKSVAIPAGVYRIPVGDNRTHLRFTGLRDFTIDARGATFVFLDVTATGIYFASCENVSFSGATLYYGTAPFTQGVIRAVAADRSYLDVQIEAGYPANLDDPKYFSPRLFGHLFDRATRLWKRTAQGDISGLRTERLSADTFRIHAGFGDSVAAGDLVAFRGGTGDHMFRVESSSGMELRDLTIFNSPIFAILESRGGESAPNRYSGITVRRGPRPVGAATDPLISTNADGFHSLLAKKGPVVENSVFEGMADDGIAVHGYYSWVIEASGNTLVVSDTALHGGPAHFAAGDTMVVTAADDNIVGSAAVVSVTPLPNYRNTRQTARQTIENYTAGPYYRVVLDREVSAGFDSLASNPSRSGAGFVLRNNTIRNHRARGINLKADDGTVENNVIDGSTMIGVRVGPEFFWGEAGYSTNLAIKGNTIANVGYWGAPLGALVVAPEDKVTKPANFRGILIAENTFRNFDVTAIYISSAAAVTVAGNTFQELQAAAAPVTYADGITIPAGVAVFVVASETVRFEENRTARMGRNHNFLVATRRAGPVQGIAYRAIVADSKADFSGAQWQGGWRYGYFPAGRVNQFVELPLFNPQTQQWKHQLSSPPFTSVHAGGAHPNGINHGADEWAVRRWMSTVSGAGEIRGHIARATPNAEAGGVFTRIYQNHKLIYEHYLAPADSTGVDYVVPVKLTAGDAIDFAVAADGADSYAGTTFNATVMTVPVPDGQPVICSVSNSASGAKGVAPGAYVSIFGQNFAPEGTFADWSRSIVDGALPTELNGVSVSIGGRPAYIAAVTPGQVNVLAPGIQTGAVDVVLTAAGMASTPFPVTSEAVSPALFAWPGAQPVATRLDYSLAVRDGTFAAKTTAARPGDTLILWGTGFGATIPAAPDGRVVPRTVHSLKGSSIVLAGKPVTVVGALLAPGLAGVYQIAVQIPSTLASGNHHLTAAVNGIPSSSSLAIAIQQ